MIKWLWKTLKGLAVDILWNYGPVSLTIIFAIISANYFPQYGIAPTGIFFICTLVVVGYFYLRKK